MDQHLTMDHPSFKPLLITFQGVTPGIMHLQESIQRYMKLSVTFAPHHQEIHTWHACRLFPISHYCVGKDNTEAITIIW